MKDPLSSCCYHSLYQNAKRLSKAGENFCKELMAVFQQRAELELTYAKGLQKMAGKLLRASKGMTPSSTCSAWCLLSDEMFSRADAHRSLGRAFQQESITELRQLLDEHSKRKRPFDGAIERTGKLVTVNWSEQLKVKKKLSGLTREHEALVNFVEGNKHICTKKEKQKMLNRLIKSAEVQTQVDEDYFRTNLEGLQTRLRLENTLKNCHQILQELEKQRMEVLHQVLERYRLQTSSLGHTLKHGQGRIEQALQSVDVDEDVRTMVERNSVAAEDAGTELLLADYFEEDSSSLMDKDRRKQAVRVKVRRLSDGIARARKDREGAEKLMRTYAGNPSFSNQKNLEETEQLLDELSLKLDLLQATHYKLSTLLSQLDGTPRPPQPCRNISIRKWKDKDCEHSVVQLTRPVKLRRTPFRSRLSLRASIIYKGDAQLLSQQTAAGCGATPTGPPPPGPDGGTQGDLLDVYMKGGNEWWFGGRDGRTGRFPSTCVEQLPASDQGQGQGQGQHQDQGQDQVEGQGQVQDQVQFEGQGQVEGQGQDQVHVQVEGHDQVQGQDQVEGRVHDQVQVEGQGQHQDQVQVEGHDQVQVQDQVQVEGQGQDQDQDQGQGQDQVQVQAVDS